MIRKIVYDQSSLSSLLESKEFYERQMKSSKRIALVSIFLALILVLMEYMDSSQVFDFGLSVSGALVALVIYQLINSIHARSILRKIQEDMNILDASCKN